MSYYLKKLNFIDSLIFSFKKEELLSFAYRVLVTFSFRDASCRSWVSISSAGSWTYLKKYINQLSVLKHPEKILCSCGFLNLSPYDAATNKTVFDAQHVRIFFRIGNADIGEFYI